MRGRTRIVDLAWGLAILAGAALALPDRAAAQESNSGTPAIGVSVRGGVLNLNAGGQFFDMMTNELMFTPSDMKGPAWGVEVSAGLMGPAHVFAGFERSSFDVVTRARGATIADGTQRLSMDVGGSFFGGLRIDLARSSHASDRSDPSRPEATLFLTAGGGWKTVDVRQDGIFPENGAETSFPAVFEGTGSTGYAFGGLGLDVTLRAGFSVLVESRYQGGAAQVDEAFARLEPLDLSGVTFSAGLQHRW